MRNSASNETVKIQILNLIRNIIELVILCFLTMNQYIPAKNANCIVIDFGESMKTHISVLE